MNRRIAVVLALLTALAPAAARAQSAPAATHAAHHPGATAPEAQTSRGEPDGLMADDDGPDDDDLLAIGPGGIARGGMGGGMRGGMGHGAMGMQGGFGLTGDLKLTDEQKAKLEDVHYRHQKQAITTQADVRLAQLELGRMLHADSPDQRAINTQIDKLADLRAGLAKSRIGALLEARAVLTPEQRKELREHRAEWGAMRGGMGGMRGGMHRGMAPPHDMHSHGDDHDHAAPGGEH